MPRWSGARTSSPEPMRSRREIPSAARVGEAARAPRRRAARLAPALGVISPLHPLPPQHVHRRFAARQRRWSCERAGATPPGAANEPFMARPCRGRGVLDARGRDRVQCVRSRRDPGRGVARLELRARLLVARAASCRARTGRASGRPGTGVLPHAVGERSPGAAGEAASNAPLLQRWVGAIVYWRFPPWVFTAVYLAVCGYTLALWWLVPPRLRRRPAPPSAGLRPPGGGPRPGRRAERSRPASPDRP